LNYYDQLQQQQQPNNTSLLMEYSRKIEADEGRQNIRICDGPAPTIVLRAHQLLHPVSQPSSASPVFLGTASVSWYSVIQCCWTIVISGSPWFDNDADGCSTR